MKWLGAGAAGLFLLLAAAVIVLHSHPSIAANGSDTLRKIFGDEAVAQMENTLYSVEDGLNQAELRLGLLHPANPFGSAPGGPVSQPVGAGSALPSAGSTASRTSDGASLASSPKAPGSARLAAPPTQWPLPQITPLGSQPGEGEWQPYLTSASGQIIAYRTFVTPDPRRPYAEVGVVAFDLHAARLHYEIGFEDPYASKTIPRQRGVIPSADLQPGVLLAAFNGGFKYRHGHFGSMANGLTSAPMRDGLGTIAIYRSGAVKLGAWGKEITASPDLIAARQNGPLLIENGQPSALVDSPEYWGYTLSGATVTWRSGVAISPDGRTLYYIAGPSLSAPTLAAAIAALHPQAAVQLDINEYWTFFTAFSAAGSDSSSAGLVSQPLFPKAMADGHNRFFQPYARDFFYVTVR